MALSPGVGWHSLLPDAYPNRIGKRNLCWRAASGTVQAAISDGTATAGQDYRSKNTTVTFAAGETERTLRVRVLDGTVDEDDETLTLTLSNASGASIPDSEATGTIRNTDAMPKAWLARFGRALNILPRLKTGDSGY